MPHALCTCPALSAHTLAPSDVPLAPLDAPRSTQTLGHIPTPLTCPTPSRHAAATPDAPCASPHVPQPQHNLTHHLQSPVNEPRCPSPPLVTCPHPRPCYPSWLVRAARSHRAARPCHTPPPPRAPHPLRTPCPCSPPCPCSLVHITPHPQCTPLSPLLPTRSVRILQELPISYTLAFLLQLTAGASSPHLVSPRCTDAHRRLCPC